ncbi:hypothetical protein ACQUW5_07485 [Legionella sp. CNM-1927-20]|uniref:hypothetical protein n=1 Tax=Legionella sp. CNM-1927-20 TaxID=3422221 RepID=UPI00403A801D
MATRPDELFKNDRPIEKASKEFRYRKEGALIKDGRDFKTWYHIDDAQRLLWKHFNDVKNRPVPGTNQLIKNLMLPPYVSFDSERIDVVNFFTVLINYFQQEENQHKRYFPFMVKPEIGSAHYIAGILRRTTEGQVDLIIFNPVGLSKNDRIGKELAKLDKEGLKIAKIISSPHTIQSTEKEKDDGPLVSCGPICVEFLRLAISDLDWLAKLNENFNLPANFLAPLEQNYQETIKQYRLQHDQLLQQVTEHDLDQLDEDYKFIVSAMFDGLAAWLKQGSAKVQKESDEDDFSSQDDYDFYDDEFYNDLNDEEEAISDEEEDLSDNEEVVEDSRNTPATKATNEDRELEKINVTSHPSPKLSPHFKQDENRSKPEQLMTSIPVEKGENKQHQALLDTNTIKTQENNPNENTPDFSMSVNYVQKEIERLRKASTSFFAIRCEKKAKLIETALKEAIQKGQDVRNDQGVREALGYHRIFSFFGLKKADALQHIEESLNLPKNQ